MLSIFQKTMQKFTGSSTAQRSPLQIQLAFISLCLSTFLVALDTTLIPTALPTISTSFHITDSLYAWTGSAYLLANAGSIPFWGKISDIFGRKPILSIANVIFLLGSILCGASTDSAMLVAGRAIQGLGGGGVVVLVHVCVSDMFAIRDRSFYIGIVGGVWAVASALGPSLGGIFAQHVNWRWCFYVNLPIVFTATIVLQFTLSLNSARISIRAGVAAMDWMGACTILTATVLLLVGLQLGGNSTYSSAASVALIVLGVLAYFAFGSIQWYESSRGGSPIMPIRIFKDTSNLCALCVCACDALVFNSVAYFLPLYFQIVLGSSPSTSGLYLLAMAIPLAIVSSVAGQITARTGRFIEVMQSGLFFMSLGVGLLISLNIHTNMAIIIGFLIIIGIGFGPNFAAPLIALQSRVQVSDIATGTAAFNFIRMVFGAIGVVIGQVLFQTLMKPQVETLLVARIPPSLVEQLTSGQALASADTIALLPVDAELVVHKGLMSALRGIWVFYTVVAATGLLLSFGINRAKLKMSAEGREEDASTTCAGFVADSEEAKTAQPKI